MATGRDLLAAGPPELVDLATRARDRLGASLRWLEVGDAALGRKPDWWQDWQPPRAAGGPPRSAIVPRSWGSGYRRAPVYAQDST